MIKEICPLCGLKEVSTGQYRDMCYNCPYRKFYDKKYKIDFTTKLFSKEEFEKYLKMKAFI